MKKVTFLSTAAIALLFGDFDVKLEYTKYIINPIIKHTKSIQIPI